MDKAELRQKIGDLAYEVTQNAATERAFTGKYDDFFEKGGDSLKAMAVVNELNNKQLSDTKISLVLLFSNSTPKMLAAALEKSKIQSENTDMEEGTI